MVKSDLFNEDSICIFTDSSFKLAKPGDLRYPGTTAPAFCVYHGNACINQGFYILHNSTSQQGELYALLLGIIESYKYKNFKHIRIFSDNQNCILGIREWIFNWMRDTQNGYKVLGPDGRIHNQNYIFDIISTIIYNNIYLEFYHVKGHVKIKDRSSIQNARRLFVKSNPFVQTADDALIYQLALGNTTVDEYSTAMLNTYIYSKEYDTTKMINPISMCYYQFDINNYSNLVNHGGIQGNY